MSKVVLHCQSLSCDDLKGASSVHCAAHKNVQQNVDYSLLPYLFMCIAINLDLNCCLTTMINNGMY